MVQTFNSPATQPGSDAVGRHSSFNMRDIFWATTTLLGYFVSMAVNMTHPDEIRFHDGKDDAL